MRPLRIGNVSMDSYDDILTEIATAPSTEALEEIRIRVLGRNGGLTLAMRGLGALAPEARREAGVRLNEARDRITAALGEAQQRLGRAALEQRLAAERADVYSAGLLCRGGPRPSDQPDHRRDRRDLWRDGLRRRRGAAYRGGFLQFHRAQHPARAPGAPGARHLLSARARRRQPAGVAHPHLAGADPHDAGAAAADPDHRAGPHLPLRPRRDALADVPSGRGAGDRPRDPYGPPQRLPDRVLPRLFRARRSAGALAPELFPVHRALGRGRYRLLAARRRVADRRRRRLARNSRQRHGAPQGAGELRHRSRRNIRALRSAWASSGWRC